MTSEHVEIERKYDVDAGAAWVDLRSLPGVHSLAAAPESALDATYYDTDRLDLVRAGITLRRRTGGSDAGWHLKLPTGSGDRLERGEPLGDSTTVPASLAALVRARVRGHELRPVATVQTRRTVHRLVDESGTVLAEAADDTVTAHASGPNGSASLSSWREWEIELADGSPDLIDAADDLIREAGAVRSPWASKLERALSARLSELPARPAIGELSPRGRAGDVVHAHLIEQVDVVIERDPQARKDEPDGVHKMRVATRRLRSALATFRPLLDRAITDPMRDELKWIAGELGAARDAEVLRMRLIDEIRSEPDDLVLGPISARIEAELRADHRKAHDELIVALDSDRYFRLLDRLDGLALAPPFTGAAEGRARKVLTRCVRRSFRRVERLVAAGAPDGVEARDAWYHEIRKAAKRLRYAAESVAPAFGRQATDLAKRAEELQEVLGEHQDSVVARAALRSLGVRLHLDGDNAFTIGRLHAIEQVRGDEAIARFEDAWSAVSDSSTMGWLKK